MFYEVENKLQLLKLIKYKIHLVKMLVFQT